MIDLVAGGIFSAMLGDNSQQILRCLNHFSLEWGNGKGEFCSYSPHRENYWRSKYTDMLKELTGFSSVALFNTGAEATEAFWRCARVYNGKPGIWGGLVDPDEAGVGAEKPKSDAWHGATLGALIMAGRMSWPTLGVYPELGAGRFGQGYETTGCMIMEPFHAPSGQFHKIDPTIKRMQELHSTHPDILFCVDEIQGGFGRTGKLWAHEHYVDQSKGTFYLKPDFITIGKLAGGGLPLSALLGPKEVMESDSVKEFAHLHSTHSGNPLMCAVGCTVIEEMQRQNLISESARKGFILHEALRYFPVKTHGKGLMAGLVFQDNAEVKRVVKLAEDRGVQVCDTGRKWVKVGPALNIPDEELTEGLKILKECVEEVVDGRVAQHQASSCDLQGGHLNSETLDLHGSSSSQETKKQNERLDDTQKGD